jgi:hypothetical protein
MPEISNIVEGIDYPRNLQSLIIGFPVKPRAEPKYFACVGQMCFNVIAVKVNLHIGKLLWHIFIVGNVALRFRS